MKKRRHLMTALLAVAVLGSGSAQTLLSSYTDANGNLTAPVTNLTKLPAGQYYRMDKRIYVTNGHKLFIEAGVVIKAESEATPEESNALVVCRGGQIFAMGTASEPIIFTHINDPLNGSFSVQNKELWGGVIILGKSHNNILKGEFNPEYPSALLGVANGVGYIEGLPYPDVRHHYGAIDTLPDGTPVFDTMDNSGVLRYVSIRHGGTDIGEANEINGLTLGSVGKGTTIDHIEVVSNGDDGIELFGGNVDLKYISVSFCEDDYIDYDQGYTGRIQFMLGVHLPTTTVNPGGTTIAYGDNGMECDGDDGDNPLRTYLSHPQIFNATIIGKDTDEGLELKERTQGLIANCILANFARGVRFEQTSSSETGVDYPGAMQLESNLFLNCNSNYSGSTAQGTALANDNNLFVTSSSIIDDVMSMTITNGIDAVTNRFNAIPQPGNPEIETDYLPDFSDGFFEYAPYKGAFAPGQPSWIKGWTIHEVKNTGFVDFEIDTNGDCVIDAIDYNNINGNYGKTCNN